MYGASSSLAKSNALPTTSSQDSALGGGAGGSSASYKHNYEGSKSSSGSGGYSYSVPGNIYGTYMGVSDVVGKVAGGHHVPEKMGHALWYLFQMGTFMERCWGEGGALCVGRVLYCVPLTYPPPLH